MVYIHNFDAGQLPGGGSGGIVEGVAGSRSSHARRVKLADEATDELVAGKLLVEVAGGAASFEERPDEASEKATM